MRVVNNVEIEKIASTVKTGAKILFANFPADGHFNPLTGLAVHLKKLGYDVRWYTGSAYTEKIARLGIPYYEFKRALEVRADKVDEIFPERKNHKSQVAKLKYDLINVFILRSTEYYDDIREIYESFSFDLVIADVAFAAIPMIKEHMRIPVISIGIVPLPETSKDLAPTGLGLTPSGSFFGKRKQAFLRLFADQVLFKKPNKIFKEILGRYGITASGNLFDVNVRKSTLFLQSGTPGFEYYRSDMSNNVRFVGPLLPYSKKKGEPWYDERLMKYERVILVTQGTVERDINKLIVPTIEAFGNSNCLVIATTGGSGTKALRAKYPFENVIVEDFIPFDDIMPYADVYVTNGGYGGVMLGIQNGLPLVVAGVHEGKNEINARVGYFKLGINLKTETPTIEQLKHAVLEIFNNGFYRKNVFTLSKEFSQYEPNELCAYYVKELLELNQPERVN